MKFLFSVSLSLLLCSALSLAQQTTPTPPVKEDENVVKISTSLVQLDVVVTDKKGNPVTNLKSEDFEVYENGKRQEITNFTYISSDKGAAEQPTNAKNPKGKSDQYGFLSPPLKLKPEQIRRTYAIVVDDLGIGFNNIYWVRQALQKFVKEQMRNGDLAAIIRTGVGIGALQSFTSNKQQLLAAIDKIKWNPQGRGGVGNFAPIQQSLGDELNERKTSGGGIRSVLGNEEEKAFERQIEDFRNENFAVGTLGALNYIISGMKELPGRKSVMLISEGFPLINRDSRSAAPLPNRAFDAMKVLADLANRSSVVIYTIDPRGLENPYMATAADDVTQILPDDFDPGKYVDPRQLRADQFRESQTSLRFLAYETGGLPFINQNNINKGLQRILDDQTGYYLIGYQPDDETFDPVKNKFNRLTVKLKRDDLKVRYRSGFFGISDEKLLQAKRQNPRQNLTDALLSPFGADDLNIQLYSFFYNEEKNQSVMRSFVYIDPNDLTFTPDANGGYQAKFDIAAVVFDSNGVGAGNNITSQTLKFDSQNLDKARRNGIIYDLPVPIIKPGAYQFRIALQDAATGKIGAASQFIEVPNLNKKRLTLSNLILKRFSLEEWKKISLKQNFQDISKSSILLNTVIRKFKRPSVFTYSFLVYNAKLNSQRQPKLIHQARLFYNGNLLITGQPTVINTANQSDSERIDSSGAITIGSELSPGDYVLQVIVTDENAKGKYQIATQLIDFEIVE